MKNLANTQHRDLRTAAGTKAMHWRPSHAEPRQHAGVDRSHELASGHDASDMRACALRTTRVVENADSEDTLRVDFTTCVATRTYTKEQLDCPATLPSCPHGVGNPPWRVAVVSQKPCDEPA